MAQNRPETHKKAVEYLSKGIYAECVEHGPESIYLCSSYYYMGELFRQDDKISETRSIFSKIAEIWKNFIVEKDLQDMRDPVMS